MRMCGRRQNPLLICGSGEMGCHRREPVPIVGMTRPHMTKGKHEEENVRRRKTTERIELGGGHAPQGAHVERMRRLTGGRNQSVKLNK